ncbi:hypothetical protein WJX72_007390 [[Myrmecia] bisecta]|uniref:Molybdate-anion transporter n=1 Tax=[Myrmecia] bisecta TaxID=41462 RepID=A0AAW1R815_9CHLO
MDVFYVAVFGALAVLAATLELSKSWDTSTAPLTREFTRFRANYVAVYGLMMAGDWLQGPYVYALYQHYGFDRGDIGRLFIAGFGSSMVFGTVVGSLADKSGRKKAALTYVATYMFGCATKHWNNFYVLLVGRVFCGVATSLLYSAFESWLVAEHFKRGFDGAWLGGVFSKAVLIGNGLVAILAGLLAHLLVETFAVGPVAPFDAASLVLFIGGLVVLTTWTENYGDTSDKTGSVLETFRSAAQAIASDQKIALLGAMQSLFEGSMYTFVFLWTPALSPKGEHLPHGMIFACFMVASMAGSALAGRLLATSSRVRPEKYMQTVFAISAVSLFVPVIFHRTTADEYDSLSPDAPGITWEGKLQLMAFCVFEFLVGIFWPSMMKMRSQYVPEGMRSTIINFFRIPLNAFVCIVLYNVSAFPLAAMFGMCTLFLTIAAACQRRLETIAGRDKDYALVDAGDSTDVDLKSQA